MLSILMGPVLSFRGLDQGNKKRWRVSAMIAIGRNEKPPSLDVDEQLVPPPVVLLNTPTFQVLRYDLSVDLDDTERRVNYGFGKQTRWEFTKPSHAIVPRIAYVSCNGFSDPKAVQKLKCPLNAVWADLLSNHDVKLRDDGFSVDKEQRWHEKRIHDEGLQRFHLLAMGGDQIYFDSIWQERETLRELCEWTEKPLEEQIAYPPTDSLKTAIVDYYFKLYLQRWSARDSKSWGTNSTKDRSSTTAMVTIPTIMMWDDHDIFDGWGSYPPELQYCPVFMHMFAAARQAFWVFQLQQCAEHLPVLIDEAWDKKKPVDAPVLAAVDWSAVSAKDELSLPFLDKQPGFSFHFAINQLSILVLDLRTERSQTQIIGESTWEAVGRQLRASPAEEHLLVMSSVPVAYPKLGLAEWGVGLGGAPNVKTGLSDDLNDHWSHQSHEGERKRLIRALISAAHARKVRITLLSGDVHVAAWGNILRKDVTPAENWMRINQLTSSAVVHPAPTGLMESIFLMYVNNAARTPQPIDTEHRVEMMLFPESDEYVQAARNWLALELDATEFADTRRHRLWATWRCEREGRFSNHLLAIHPVRP